MCSTGPHALEGLTFGVVQGVGATAAVRHRHRRLLCRLVQLALVQLMRRECKLLQGLRVLAAQKVPWGHLPSSIDSQMTGALSD